MLLRWMSRRGSEVDMGMWNIDTSKLIIPLDTHVMRVSSSLGLIKGREPSMARAVEITEKLRKFDERDPVRYDFALYGLGIENII